MNTAKTIKGIVTLACLLFVSCHGNMNEVWTGGSGSVPISTSAPKGFKISPREAQVIAQNEYGMRKTVQHIYADAQYYYIVDGFFGSSGSRAAKTGVRVNGKTGALVRFERP